MRYTDLFVTAVAVVHWIILFWLIITEPALAQWSGNGSFNSGYRRSYPPSNI